MMNGYELIIIAVGLAMDAFAVAIACSCILGRVTPRQIFRFAFHFGLFQAMMPVLGWLAGTQIDSYIRAWDHWIAFGLLAYVGGRAIREALSESSGEAAGCGDRFDGKDPTRGMRLVVYSVATSIDAMAVGLSMAVLDVRIWTPAVVIGVITAGMTTVGMFVGARLGDRFGKGVEVLGGGILIAIGLKILISHLLAP